MSEGELGGQNKIQYGVRNTSRPSGYAAKLNMLVY